MKLILDSAELTTALRMVARRVPSRPAVRPLAGVKCTATGGTLTLSTFNYAVSVQSTAPAAVQEAGTALIPGKELWGLARTLPARGDVDLTVEGGRANLASGPARASIPVLAVEEYPTLPTPASPTASLTGEDLAVAVQQVATAAGTDETLPIATCLCLELGDSTLKLAATDRYRAAYRELPVRRTSRRRTRIVGVPAKEIADAATALRRAETVSLALPTQDEQPLALSGGRTAFTTSPLDGGDRLARLIPAAMPAEFATTLTAPSRPLIAALQRIELTSERNASVHLHIDPAGQVHIRSGHGDSTHLADRVDDCTVTGEGMRIAFTSRFLLEGLRALRCRKVQINLTTPDKAALLHAADASPSALRYLLMPRRPEETGSN